MSALLLGHELVTDQEGMLFFSTNVLGRNLTVALFFVRFIGVLESSHVRELVAIFLFFPAFQFLRAY